MILQVFDYEIQHRKGSKNHIVSNLSKIMIDGACESPSFECFHDE